MAFPISNSTSSSTTVSVHPQYLLHQNLNGHSPSSSLDKVPYYFDFPYPSPSPARPENKKSPSGWISKFFLAKRNKPSKPDHKTTSPSSHCPLGKLYIASDLASTPTTFVSDIPPTIHEDEADPEDNGSTFDPAPFKGRDEETLERIRNWLDGMNEQSRKSRELERNDVVMDLVLSNLGF